MKKKKKKNGKLGKNVKGMQEGRKRERKEEG
jgi:hypothetical protein